MKEYYLEYKTTVFNDDRNYSLFIDNDIESCRSKLLRLFKTLDIKLSKSKLICVEDDKQFVILSSFELELLSFNGD